MSKPDAECSNSRHCSAATPGTADQCSRCGTIITEDDVLRHGWHVDEETDSDVCKRCFDRETLLGAMGRAGL